MAQSCAGLSDHPEVAFHHFNPSIPRVAISSQNFIIPAHSSLYSFSFKSSHARMCQLVWLEASESRLEFPFMSEVGLQPNRNISCF